MIQRLAIIAALVVISVGPVAASLTSPLLAWRQPIYIVAAAAGVAALGLMVVQTFLMIPSLKLGHPSITRLLHRWVGSALVGAVFLHVFGLWLSSPPDVIDTLLLRSPAPFGNWGVLALVAIVALVGMALTRKGWSGAVWPKVHLSWAALAILATVVHMALIDGTMQSILKWTTGAILAVAFAAVVLVWLPLRTPR